MANLPCQLREIRQKTSISHGPLSTGRLRQALRAIGETLVIELEKLINAVESGHAFDKSCG